MELKRAESALATLAAERRGEAVRIRSAVTGSRVVGVLGEAETGKTRTVRQALGPLGEERAVLELDLDGVASESHLAFHVARHLASAVLGQANFSVLKVGALVPTSLEPKRVELAELLGIEGVEEALRDWPSGTFDLDQALTALATMARRRDVLLWLDHLEAPTLTPRHPLDLERLLWSLREMVQRISGLALVLSGRNPLEPRILGPEAAFHQQGEWLTLDYPPHTAWSRLADSLGLGPRVAEGLAELTDGHPETMLIALLTMSERKSDDPRATLLDLAATAQALGARSMQHANSLHRLGGQILLQIAQGEKPYAEAQRGGSATQDVYRVLNRLQLAGLIRHGRGWSVVNPLVRILLSQRLEPPSAPEWPGQVGDGL